MPHDSLAERAARSGSAATGMRGEPPDSGTTAEIADQIVVGETVLDAPFAELVGINRIGQILRRLVSEFWHPGAAQQIDHVSSAVFHGYHLAPASALLPPRRGCQAGGGSCECVLLANYPESEPNRSWPGL